MKIGLTHMGNIEVIVRGIARQLNIELVIPPHTSIRTLNLGVKNSPEEVCFPFKLQLGNMLEALENGADVLVMSGGPGPCRLGYYHKLLELILKEMGYKFTFVTQKDGIWHMVTSLTKGIPVLKVLGAYRLSVIKNRISEDLEKLALRVRAREQKPGQTTRIITEAVAAIDETTSHKRLREVETKYRRLLNEIPQVAGIVPLKIGISGEIFLVNDSFSNMNVEIELGKLHCEVYRGRFLGDLLSLNPFFYLTGQVQKDKASLAARPYVSCFFGGDGRRTVGEKLLHSRDWDGIVHLEPMGCMPEITARNILLGVPNSVPQLDLIFDEHTGKTGVITRLEAFIDMLRRKEKAIHLRYTC